MTPDYILYKTVMSVYNIKDNFLPKKMMYNMLDVSNYTIYKQRKDIKMHPEYDANPVPYVTSIHFLRSFHCMSPV
jgi:hypothetical protein